MRSPREICYYFSNFAFPYPFFNQDYATDWIDHVGKMADKHSFLFCMEEESRKA